MLIGLASGPIVDGDCGGLMFQAAKQNSPLGVNDRLTLLSNRVNDLEKQICNLKAQHAKEIAALKKSLASKKVTVTAYSASKAECDSDPKITASMSKLRPGVVAVSRDLFNHGWVFGKRVYIEGHGIYEIVDLMNKKHKNRIDVYIGHKKKAEKFGKRELTVALLPDKK